MSQAEIDEYLEGVGEPARSTLEQLRLDILDVVPGAEQCISYKVPAFRVDGSVVAGFAAFKNHLSYLPFSGSTLAAVPDAASYDGTKSALHFPADAPLPKGLVQQLVEARLTEIRRPR